MKTKLLKIVRKRYEIGLMDMNYHLLDKRNRTIVLISSSLSKCIREIFIRTCSGFEVCEHYNNTLNRKKQTLYKKIQQRKTFI